VTIDGAGYSITGDRTGTALSTVVHDNIVIRNLHVKNFYFGIKLYFSKNSLIEDCSVMDNEGPGITLETHTQNTTVRRNTVRLNDARGIYINGAENNTIQANVVTENNRGIYLINNSTGNTITNNTVNDNQSAGIVLNGCTNNTLSGNYLARNTVEGLALYDQSDANIIQANNIRHHPQAGIIVSESDGNTFADNLVTDIAQDGIYLYLSTNNQLTGNTFCDNGDGVTSFDIDDAGANSGSNNMCRNAHNYDDTDAAAGGCARECAACGCDTGTVIYRCGDTLTQSCTMTCSLTSSGTCFTIGADDLTINGGNFGLIGNHQYDTYGIYALGKKNLTVKNLEVYDFFGGIYLESVTGSTLASNKVHSNDQGIMLAFSSNNQLTNNVVYTNENAGILLAYGSGGNVVSGNSADGNGFGIRLLFNADLNDLLNNTIRNSTINGIYLDFDTNENDLQSNTICSNPVDIYEDGSNGGDGNACATTQNWDDTGTSGCTKSCEPKRVKALPWILMLLDR
jgi:parallel beta-helix repeat protein